MTTLDAKADCYSAGERGAMGWWQDLRARWLGPLLAAMGAVGIRPDHVTAASLAAGLAFCPLWLWPDGPAWAKPAALVALLLHVLLDGLDGPLARHLGTASSRGSFTDSLADQIVVTATTLALMAAPQPGVLTWIGGTYIFLYATVVGFAMVRNALGNPYTWLVRPRLWVYGWIAVDLALLPGWIDYVIGAFTVVLALKVATGFVALRRML
ncbi:MAG TPA: CDP-alcohol phosphatidyltransferase family protein [Pirellulaceae bacterium]|nr:CDP-alcohol phosphatidyltransferase family protein [Pirellulaceae bacterium]